MMPHHKRLAWTLLFLLGFAWGASFILIKKGLLFYKPEQVAAIRLIIAGTVLLPLTIYFFNKISWREMGFLFLSGLIGNGIPAFLFPLSQTMMSSSMAGILNGLTPIFALLMGFLFFNVALTNSKIIGCIVALAGAALIVLSSKSGVSISSIWGPCLAVLATALYGFNVNLIKSKLTHLNPIAVGSFPLTFMSIPAWVILFSTPISQNIAKDIGLESLMYLAILGLFGTAISLILFNRLVQISTALFASFTTYLIPMFAIMWGMIDGEFLNGYQIAGMGLILGGIIVGSLDALKRKTKVY